MIAFCLPNKSESIFVGQLDFSPAPDLTNKEEQLSHLQHVRKPKTNNRLNLTNKYSNDERMLLNKKIDESILVNIKTSSRRSSPLKSIGTGSEPTCKSAHQNLTPSSKHGNKAFIPAIDQYNSNAQSKLARNAASNVATSISKCFACCANQPSKLANKPNKSQYHHQHNHQYYQNQEKNQNDQEPENQAPMLINKATACVSSSLKSRQANFKRPRPIIIQEFFNHSSNNSSNIGKDCAPSSREITNNTYCINNNSQLDKSNRKRNDSLDRDPEFNDEEMKQNMINLERIKLSKPIE